MKIALATLGRFWILDLARELTRLGHEVAVWSILPANHLERFGVLRESHRSLLPRLWPLVAAWRYGGRGVSRWASPRLLDAADRLIARRLEPCDVFIGISGLSLESARAARLKFGAKVMIERGSRHIRSQKRILDDLVRSNLAADTVSDSDVVRELAGYALADRVVVPSAHARQSFVDEGFPDTRLFCNPYGVDLSLFPPTRAPRERPPTILFVGAWSYRKGVDLLVDAWRRLEGVQLLHVGEVGDAVLPSEPGFTHVEPVPQRLLANYYAQAHLFVLASREEGLALVQAQALACGVPLVCSDRTGGEDLQRQLDDPSWVTVVPSGDADALVHGIRAMLAVAMTQRGQRDVLGLGRTRLSWSAYGERYALELERVAGGGA